MTATTGAVQTSTTIEEESLLARLRMGDDAAFDELVRTAGGRMLAVARRMMNREEDAQDAVQDAFLSAFKSLDHFDGRSQLTTWLHRITVNACLMKLRSQRRRGDDEQSIDALLPQFLADGHQTIPSKPWKPAEQTGIEQAELRDHIRAKIADLPEPYRMVILLRDIEELDTETTAQLLELSPAAVKTRLHRARQALKTLLDPSMIEGVA